MWNLSTILGNKKARKSDLKTAIRHHLNGTHITRTFSDGSVGRLEACWHPDEQRFIDPMNNIWLRRNETGWWVSVRHDYDLAVNAMVAKANAHARRERLNEMWHLYWILILMDQTQCDLASDGVSYDIHITPFVESDWV